MKKDTCGSLAELMMSSCPQGTNSALIIMIMSDFFNLISPIERVCMCVCFRYRIGPFEVENALIEHPAVAESAVVSSPDPVRGEVVQCILGLQCDLRIGQNYLT